MFEQHFWLCYVVQTFVEVAPGDGEECNEAMDFFLSHSWHDDGMAERCHECVRTPDVFNNEIFCLVEITVNLVQQ